MEIYYFEENRRIFLAITLSILLHLLLAISLELRLNFPWLRHKEKVAQSSDIIRFDLIEAEPPLIMETPKVEKEEIPPKPTNIISDKNVRAKDRLEKTEDITEVPHVEGKTKIKEIETSIPQSASIPQKEALPQPEIRLGEEKAGIEMLPSEKSLPEEVPPQEEAQKETIASIPKETLRIPLFDGRLSNAQSFGEVTFNAKKHDVAPYIIKMKDKIEKHWAPPVVFTYYGLTSGETVVNFKIMPDGRVEDVKVIREKGDESLKKSSLQAILDATPFEPIPPDVLKGEKEKYLGITFTFYYIIDTPEEDNI